MSDPARYSDGSTDATSEALDVIADALAAPAKREATDDMVERLRRSLWASWGANRQTTDWPSDAQLRAALEAALEPVAPAVAFAQKLSMARRRPITGGSGE